MSAKIGVLEHGEDPQRQAGRHVKRSVAQTLVRRSLAEWVDRFTIQMRALAEYRPIAAGQFIPPSHPYIPEKMPPVDLPGIRFVLPIKPWMQPHGQPI